MSDLNQLRDTELILLILAAIYLWECISWLRGEAVCFVSRWRHHILTGSLLPLQNEQGRIVFTNPMPMATSFVCQAWPLAISPEGIAPSDAIESGKIKVETTWVSFDDVGPIGLREREILAGGRVIARATSHEHAAFLAARLRMIRDTPPKARAEMIRSVLDETLDTETVSTRLATLHREADGLRRLCTMLVLYTFLVGPVLYYLPGLDWERTTWPYLAGFVIFWWLLIIEYYFVRRKLRAETRGQRIWHSCMLFFSPSSAMRSAETVSRNLLAPFHPIAAAAILCDKNRFPLLAERTLRELQYPLPLEPGHDSPRHEQTHQWFRQELITRIKAMLDKRGLDPLPLPFPFPFPFLKDPKPTPDAQSYCPRCVNQYTIPRGECPDCKDVRLVKFGT